MTSFWKDKKTLVTGGSGFVGHAVIEELNRLGCTQVIAPKKQECNLTIESNVKDLFSSTKPEIVIHLAGKVGGIMANKNAPAEFFYKNINKFHENLIKIDFTKTENYKKEIDTSKINVGLVWSGSFYGPKEPYRSIPLSKLNKILTMNANFYCLQKDIRDSDKSTFDKSDLINYGILSLEDIPSFIKNLDLVISTDTSILHMSGSIEKETWALLSIDPDWRWGKLYDLDPYTSLKIYKQNNFDNWDEVLDSVKNDLEKKIDLFKKQK